MNENEMKQLVADVVDCLAFMDKNDTWRFRISKEYADTKARYERLHAANVNRKTNDNTRPCEAPPYNVKEANLLDRQEKVMRDYLDILEMRMALANIPF